MPLGPRKRDGMLKKQGVIINPKGPKGDLRANSSSGAGASGMAVKQDKTTGKKYDSPHYPKKDEKVKPFGGK